MLTKTRGGQHNSTPKEIEKDCNSRGFEYNPTNNTCEPCPNDEQHTLTSDNRCVFTESSVSQMTSNITCGMKAKDKCTSPCQWDENAREGKGKCVAANATTSTEATTASTETNAPTAAASAAKAVADINIDIPCDRYNNAPEACGKTNGKCKWEKDTCIENKTEPTKQNNAKKQSNNSDKQTQNTSNNRIWINLQITSPAGDDAALVNLDMTCNNDIEWYGNHGQKDMGLNRLQLRVYGEQTKCKITADHCNPYTATVKDLRAQADTRKPLRLTCPDISACIKNGGKWEWRTGKCES